MSIIELTIALALVVLLLWGAFKLWKANESKSGRSEDRY